ncbi:MAG: ECF transporter S component [Oscillospiraceae bacterium]|jgi:riboflavin transporter FmnP|nr:ECF transporter S component [Oscillospiraceae bacterium]
MSTNTRKLTLLAMFAALAYALVFFIRIPVVPMPPLSYEPKDVVIVIAGFLFGPLSSFVISVLVSVLEMVTFSSTWVWGCLMNIVATCSFAFTASFIYKKRRTLRGAAVGLAVAAIFATGVMLVWNYFITPIYTGFPRAAVAGMLIPTFLPFNLLKTGLNAGFALLLYQPLRLALGRARLLLPSGAKSGRKISLGVVLVSVFIIATGALLILVWKNII